MGGKIRTCPEAAIAPADPLVSQVLERKEVAELGLQHVTSSSDESSVVFLAFQRYGLVPAFFSSSSFVPCFLSRSVLATIASASLAQRPTAATWPVLLVHVQALYNPYLAVFYLPDDFWPLYGHANAKEASDDERNVAQIAL